ncbi:porin [Gynurincola endophyticus]|uniref:porin n=1 Tax=Gynurincola endophyticus TaxID=2479004 RepID=UPI0018F7AB2D|nr:porin [Gynurincola endophyticus]
MKKIFLLFGLTFVTYFAYSQKLLMDMVDTTSDVGKGLLDIYKHYNYLRLSGYIHPQYQVIQEKGAQTYNGGNFNEHSDNRFMFRRARFRFDFLRMNDLDQPVVQVVMQIDGTERGVNIRDFWGRYFENKLQLFSFTMGMFARPFGHEVNYSSQFREVPERGRMSQILMRTERDLGAMITFRSRKAKNALKNLQFDVGVFNGQGLISEREYDSYKDLISRITYRDIPIVKNVTLNVGLSTLQGGIMQPSKYSYHTAKNQYIVDSNVNHIGRRSPRIYYGADAQLKWKHRWGQTQLRAEYWKGKQSAYQRSSETPDDLEDLPFFVRDFDGAFVYLLQDIVNPKHQFGIRYDFYDPNRDVKGEEIYNNGVFSAADIRYDTWSVGYNYYMSENLKLMIWYDMPRNEKTRLTDFTSDKKDNIFTFRIQYTF